MKKLPHSLVIAAIVFASCNPGADKSMQSTTSPTVDTTTYHKLSSIATNQSQEQTTPQTQAETPAVANGAQTNQPAANQQVANKQQTVPQTTTTAANKSKAGLNPAHGEPGHRCDIPVGSPLNSAPTATTTQPKPQPQSQPSPLIQTVTQPANPLPAATNTSGNAKLNPAHGEPGHDCTIPVGQPLKN